MKFGKLFAVFQAYPADPGKTIVTAFMALAIKTRVLDENAVLDRAGVAQPRAGASLDGSVVLQRGQFDQRRVTEYARNEIKTIAELLAHD